jgi:hypothetical protein
MPITSDPTEYWPKEALEVFRTWVNEGCRKSKNDAIVSKIVIKNRVEPPMTLGGHPPKVRIRKDIRNLTDLEIQTYRSKFLNILQADKVHLADGNPTLAQELGELRKYVSHWRFQMLTIYRCLVVPSLSRGFILLASSHVDLC